MIQVNRIYLIFNRLVTKKFLVDTSEFKIKIITKTIIIIQQHRHHHRHCYHCHDRDHDHVQLK